MNSEKTSSPQEMFPYSLVQGHDVIIGLVAPIGVDRDLICSKLETNFDIYGYQSMRHKVSQYLRKGRTPANTNTRYDEIIELMKGGNDTRRDKHEGILALQTVRDIGNWRRNKTKQKTVWIIDSIKHPQEINVFRSIYGDSFYLLAVQVSHSEKVKFLRREFKLTDSQSEYLISKDESDAVGHGQQVKDSFQHGDYFLEYGTSENKLNNSIGRFVRLLFNDPFETPTFNEYSMFLAYIASMRSADLARQVGAVVADATNKEILSLGANDCPSPGGGLYWPKYDREACNIYDVENGKDYTRRQDPNVVEKNEVVEDVTDRVMRAIKESEEFKDDGTLFDDKKLEESIAVAVRSSRLKNITEYGRSIHAEMEAILSCARRGVSLRGATLYATTFPCHNCARHIIGAGISQVFYIEPYPKSKALVLHDDAICESESEEDKVNFLPYVGVGPKKYINFFSLALADGLEKKRKDDSSGAAMSTHQSMSVNEKKELFPRFSIHSDNLLNNEQRVIEWLEEWFPSK